MTAHRPVTAGVAALVGVVALGLTTVTAGTARAHGAPTDPVSRVAACGPEGVKRTTAACRAAVDANGGSALDEWDNLRVADVRGRDREVVPDGQLCSAGLEAYRGLDIARADWPTTTLRAGAGFTLTYRSTIPHKGTFSLYLTKEGYAAAVVRSRCGTLRHGHRSGARGRRVPDNRPPPGRIDGPSCALHGVAEHGHPGHLLLVLRRSAGRRGEARRRAARRTACLGIGIGLGIAGIVVGGPRRRQAGCSPRRGGRGARAGRTGRIRTAPAPPPTVSHPAPSP